MDKVQVLARSRSDFAGGVDELTFRGTGTLEKTDYGYRLRYTAQNELDGSAVASEMRLETCLLYISPSPRDTERSRMPSSA